MRDSKITAELSLEQTSYAEGNLGLLQVNCCRKKIYKIHKVLNLYSGKYCQGKKAFLNRSTVFPFQSIIVRASIP